MSKVNIILSYKNRENIPIEVKNKLTKKFYALKPAPSDIDWNFGITAATDLRTSTFTSKAIYAIEQKEDLDLEEEAKKICDKLREDVKSFDMDIEIEGYELC
ncbi:MAG: hypothetical protein MRJ65_02990 [Candidatus Brocadiaceae bacterium]|nr:hypothetical protein [Candidatus Brocadiaceae bacterium]